MKITCKDCGTVRNEPFCPKCVKPFLIDAQVTAARTEAKAKFLEGVTLVDRVYVAYCGPEPLDKSVPDRCTPAERRQGWRYETSRNRLPDEFRCEDGVAVGAHFGNIPTEHPSNGQALKNVDEGVVPPNLDPYA
jgi:hypothetical protein